jgi:hypothetical protein
MQRWAVRCPIPEALIRRRFAKRGFFTELTNLYKNWNCSAENSTEFDRYHKEIEALAVVTDITFLVKSTSL